MTNQGYAAVTYEEFVAGMHQAASEVDVAEKPGSVHSDSEVAKSANVLENNAESATNMGADTLRTGNHTPQRKSDVGSAIFRATAASTPSGEPEAEDGGRQGSVSADGVPVQATVSPTRPALLRGNNSPLPATSKLDNNGIAAEFEDNGFDFGDDGLNLEDAMEVEDDATGNSTNGTPRRCTPQGNTKEQSAPSGSTQINNNGTSIAPKRDAPARGAEESGEDITSQRRDDDPGHQQLEDDYNNEKHSSFDKSAPKESDSRNNDASSSHDAEESRRGSETEPAAKSGYITQEQRAARHLPDDIMFIGEPDGQKRVRMEWSGGEIIRGGRKKDMSEHAIWEFDRKTNLSLELFTRRLTTYDDITTFDSSDTNFNDKTQDCFTASFQKVSCLACGAKTYYSLGVYQVHESLHKVGGDAILFHVSGDHKQVVRAYASSHLRDVMPNFVANVAKQLQDGLAKQSAAALLERNKSIQSKFAQLQATIVAAEEKAAAAQGETARLKKKIDNAKTRKHGRASSDDGADDTEGKKKKARKTKD